MVGQDSESEINKYGKIPWIVITLCGLGVIGLMFYLATGFA